MSPLPNDIILNLVSAWINVTAKSVERDNAFKAEESRLKAQLADTELDRDTRLQGLGNQIEEHKTQIVTLNG